MKEKAMTNLRAAEALHRGTFYDSCASRAYYGVYLASWHKLEALNLRPDAESPTGDRYWGHYTLPTMLRERTGLLNEDERDKLEVLRDYRMRADYFRDPLEGIEAEDAMQFARELIHLLLERPESR